MKQTGVIYFYNLNSPKGRQIRMLCLKLGLQIRPVDRSMYLEPIGALAGVPGYERTGEQYLREGFSDEMLLMNFYKNGMLDSFLKGFKTMKIESVALKAILTESNCGWNSLELHEELVKEHETMAGYRT